ncbi:hypothetical protein L218DRAFT_963385 [Marasmius fiardii PR-910]|nr:hypothetical protein L218DRAFT_963385 [Marasmius fiardii PR-910]
MGGDHKCPVCQATFTRPQHVARHMRSHTGDRPYKCQHCGDQFARSDLLSRHVNKCHAGEKALIGGGVSGGGGPGSAGGRRKGSTATRATTSKQACDQCVQSSLPCDGCNPCSKCIQRKCRCTYVKFHRQTAPIGPGHNPRPIGASMGGSAPGMSMSSATGIPGGSLLSNPSTSAAAAANVALYASSLHQHHAGLHPSHSQHGPHPHSHPHLQAQVAQAYNSLYPTDEFLLGPAPGSGIPNISGSSSGGGPSTSSNSASGAGGSSGAGFGTGSFTFPPVYAQGGGGSHSDGEGGDYTTRYRELMRRGSVPSATYPAPGGDVDLIFGPGGGYYGSSGGGGGYYRNQDFRRGGGGSGGHHHESESESESGSASATSSSVHLPLGVGVDGFVSNGSQQYLLNAHHHGGHDSSASPPNLQSHMHPPPPSSTTGPSGAPGPPGGHSELSRPGTAHGVSSVFGLMSLDDPNVLAGLATDGQPFFHDAFGDVTGVDVGGGIIGGAGTGTGVVEGSDPNATPMPRFTNTSPHQGAASGLPPIGGVEQQSSSSSASPPSSVNHGQHLQRPSTSGGRHSQQQQQQQQQQHLQQAQQFPTTPGVNREQETRELREFWKQYMRTPLSGGGGAGLLGVPNPPNSSSSSGQQDVNMMSPGIPGYRRGRVSSLPSVKTPTEELYPIGSGFSQQVRYGKPHHHHQQQQQNHHSSHHHHHQSQQPHPHPHPHPSHGPTAQTATGTDDLKSYEAAVLARKAPTNLNLAPKVRKRGIGNVSGSTGGSGGGGAAAKGVSFAPTPTGVLSGGGGGGGMNGITPTGVANASGGGSTSPSRRRPSFKRLASQTLESGVAKRALLMNSEDGDGDDEGDEWEGDGDEDAGFTSSGGVHMSPQPLVRKGAGSDGVSSTSSASPVVPPPPSSISGINPVLAGGGVGSGSPLMFAKSPMMVSTDG